MGAAHLTIRHDIESAVDLAGNGQADRLVRERVELSEQLALAFVEQPRYV